MDYNFVSGCTMKPLTDARLYGHRDICRILEVNGGKDFIHDQPLVIFPLIINKFLWFTRVIT